MPDGQSEHEDAPEEDEYLPAGQEEQTEAPDNEKYPAEQDVQ